MTSAACFTLGALAAFVPSDSPLSPALRSLLDPLAVVGAGSLGLSLVLVHMYVTPIKRFMQVNIEIALSPSAQSISGPSNPSPEIALLVELVLINGPSLCALLCYV